MRYINSPFTYLLTDLMTSWLHSYKCDVRSKIWLVYLPEEHSCQISSWSDLKQRRRTRWVAIWDQFPLLLKKVKGRHLYTATYMSMTSSGLQCDVAY